MRNTFLQGEFKSLRVDPARILLPRRSDMDGHMGKGVSGKDFRNSRPKETIALSERNAFRLVQPEEVGEAVRFLCSEAGAALTGDCIRIDWGQMLK